MYLIVIGSSNIMNNPVSFVLPIRNNCLIVNIVNVILFDCIYDTINVCWWFAIVQKRICFLFWLICDHNGLVVNGNQWCKCRQNENISQSTHKECTVWLWMMFCFFKRVPCAADTKNNTLWELFLSRSILQLWLLHHVSFNMIQVY